MKAHASKAAVDEDGIGGHAGLLETSGYVGSPRHATADLGHRIFEADSNALVSIALRLLDGEVDERKTARLAALLANPGVAKVLEPSRQRDAAIAQRQQEWIAVHRKP
jgi:hypothetical protein